MEDKKYLKIIEVLTDKVSSLELDNSLKGYEIDQLKKRLETTLDQLEVQLEVKETR